MRTPFHHVAKEIAIPLLLDETLSGFLKFCVLTLRRPIDPMDIVQEDLHKRCAYVAENYQSIIAKYLTEAGVNI